MNETGQHGGRLAAFLILVCLGLAYLCFVPLIAPGSRLPSMAHDGVGRQKEYAVEPFDEGHLDPLSTFSEISERPLFSPTRRPISRRQEPGKERVRRTRNEYVLQGLTSAPEGRRALLLDRGAGKLLWVSQSEKLDGWLVEHITLDGVVLSRSGQRRQLHLEDQPGLRRKVPKSYPPPPPTNRQSESKQQTAEPAAQPTVLETPGAATKAPSDKDRN